MRTAIQLWFWVALTWGVVAGAATADGARDAAPPPAAAVPAAAVTPPPDAQPAPDAGPPGSEVEPVLPPILAEVLSLAERETVFPLSAPATQEKLIQAILEVVGCGARLVPNAAAAGEPAAVEAPVILHSRCVYLPLHRLDASTVQAIAKARSEVKPEASDGLILDLRYAQGGTVEDARQAVAALAGLGKPLVLVVSGQTTGASEIFAFLTRKSLGAVLIGQPTHGCQASLEPFALSTGQSILLPKPVPEVDGVKMPGAPLLPDVTMAPLPAREQLAGLTAERFDALPDRDPALRRAVDLLTTIRAFGTKHF